MAHGSTEGAADGRLDLVPLIDCVMLLLLFFILTSRFSAEDLRIAALLPAGGSDGGKPVVAPPPTVRIAVLPGVGRMARIRIGGGEELQVDAGILALPGGPAVEREIDTLHAALAGRLEAYEQAGGRREQAPVEIHCSTRLPWSCALVVYDAVRAYERARAPAADLPLEAQRSVAFAAPVVRNSRGDNAYDEQQRLEHLR